METLCTATGVDNPCARRRHVNMMFDAHQQHGEMGRASGCRGIDMVYGGYRVVYKVEDASQKPPRRRVAI